MLGPARVSALPGVLPPDVALLHVLCLLHGHAYLVQRLHPLQRTADLLPHGTWFQTKYTNRKRPMLPSVLDPLCFVVDRDPGISTVTTGLRIRIVLFPSVALKRQQQTFLHIFKYNKLRRSHKSRIFLLVDGRIRNRRNNCGSGSGNPKTNGASDLKNTGADIKYPPFNNV